MILFHPTFLRRSYLACFVAAALMNPVLAAASEPSGLVGHWSFDDGTGSDLSGQGNNFEAKPGQIYSLGQGKGCLMVVAEKEKEKEKEKNVTAGSIKVQPDSALAAIERGTFCFWLNVAKPAGNPALVLGFNNKAVELNLYRGHFAPRFRGDGEFVFGGRQLGPDWPNHPMRESAFYPHEKAVAGEGEWHHFAVAYDDRAKRITGWRDGELIAEVDLSTVGMEPLLRKKLSSIVPGKGFSGFIDDIRIYNRPLSTAEVASIHAKEKSTFAGRNDTIPDERRLRTYSYVETDRSLYRAWLQNRPATATTPKSKELPGRVVAPGDNPTVQNAARELASALKEITGAHEIYTGPAGGAGSRIEIGTPETSEWIRRHAEALELNEIKNDGYVLKSIREGNALVVTVAAPQPAGVIFGTFDLIRRVQLSGDIAKLDHRVSPTIPVRMVNHWDIWRGFPHDDWYGKKPEKPGKEAADSESRRNSIYSWKEIRDGDTQRIRDWARLLASAGWNAVCPAEINWEFRNNFLEHLDEVKTLASIFREYGIRLYWTPNQLLALRKETADLLYKAVPDFGGYLLKLGSEAQDGDPRPAMVNIIADNLKPHGGHALVRAFVYGKSRYSVEDYRNLNPHDVIAPFNGVYRDNVIIVSKGSPLDWDHSAPIPALDGAMDKNLYGSELVIVKKWPLSWVEKWKWWLEQDNYRQGAGSLNKFSTQCIMGVSMMSPNPAWTLCPLNMVNFYGLGRLAQNPNLSVDELYTEWIRLTFGDDPEVVSTIKTILLLSDDSTRKLYYYRGYRGVWLDLRKPDSLVQRKTTHTIDRDGIGTATPELRDRVLAQYAPGLRKIYGDPVRGEEFFASFNYLPLDYRLSSGRTVIQDFFENPDHGVRLAAQMAQLWRQLQGKIDERRFQYTLKTLEEWARDAKRSRDKAIAAIENVTGRSYAATIEGLDTKYRGVTGFYNIQDFGARGDGLGNNAGAIMAAIDACHAEGGGTVFVPAGIYATGSIRLRSNVTLALDAGAVLLALDGAMNPWEPNMNDAGLMDPAYYHFQASLLWGENIENVKVIGPGALDGSALTRSSKVPAGSGDKAIALKQCRSVEIRNLRIEQGGHYAILASGCSDMSIDNVTINTGRDGINLMQCRNVVISNCHIDSLRYKDGEPAGGDDSIKLGSDLALGKILPSENIVVRDCYLASGCNAVQFGSETIGTFKNIRFENIRIGAAGKAGISVTSNDGSVIEDVTFRNITMERTFAPIFVKLSDVARVPSNTYKRGAIRGLLFENVTATNCYSSFRKGEMPSVVWGKPETPIEDVLFRNIRITVKGGHPASEANLDPAENDGRFPKDAGMLPAHGFYLRNVSNIRFEQCVFDVEKSDARPIFVVDRGNKVRLASCTGQKGTNAPSLVDRRNGSDVRIEP